MDEPWPAEDFAGLTKPLPAEPFRWERLPPTARQRAFQALGWFVFVTAMVCLATRAWTVASVALWVGGPVVVAWIVVWIPGGIADRWRTARLEAAWRRHPDEPWIWDHRWDPRGVSGSPLRRWLRRPPHLVGLIGVLPGIVTSGSSAPALRWVWGTLAGAVVTWKAWSAWRVFGVGTAHVTFTKFPFHPGERVTLLFGMAEGGATFERASFHLRRVVGGGPFSTTSEARGIVLHRPPGELPAGGHHVQLEFDLPATARGTGLSGSPRAYWALDVVANTSAGPYVESFLIPIYERPPEPATDG